MEESLKQLLLKDLCARLLYGIKLKHLPSGDDTILEIIGNSFVDGNIHDLIDNFKPYLRSMESMTEEEENEMLAAFNVYYCRYDRVNNVLDIDDDDFDFKQLGALVDWLNAHHFDYRGLIEKGLALEAPEGIYN